MKDSFFNELNQEQKQAVTHTDGPLLIVAGAGTGKTTVITKRIAWLIQEGLAKSDEILALTFTEKAANEMEERVDRLLPLGYVDLWISTFHSFGERILKEHAIDIGLSSDCKLLKETEQWMLVRKNLDRFNLDYYRPMGNPTRFIHALLSHFSRAKDECVRPEGYLKYAEKLRLDADTLISSKLKVQNSKLQLKTKKGKIASSKNRLIDKKDSAWDVGLGEEDGNEILRIQEVADAYHVYQQLLLENGALDFGDLINYTLELFDKRPKILEEYRKKFKFILLDEFQDTNWAQYELIKKLAFPNNNLTVCADDDQSIYRFRGASTSNVLQFIKDFPNSKQVFLVKNYRNRQNLLDMAYQFIQLNNPDRLEYQLQNHSLAKQMKRSGAREKKNSEDSMAGLSKRLIAENSGDAVVEYIHAKTAQQEAREVAKKIFELHQENWSDFAVLVRANSSAGPFLQAFLEARIPYQFLASSGLYTQPVILDIISFLRLLDNYHDSPSLYRLLNLPVYNISPQEISQLTYLSRKKSWSLYEAMRKHVGQIQLPEESQRKIEKILSLVEKHMALSKEKSVGKVILSFLEESGYLQFLKNQNEQKAREDLRYLNQFYKEVIQFEEGSVDVSVREFLSNLEYILASGDLGSLTPDWEEGPDVVKIMTVHAAKGLEFPYVFLANLVDKRFPTIERKEAISLPDALVKEILPKGDIHLQEERRLFYVGMTRAQKGLFFTSAEDYGGARKKKPSRFLEELHVVEKRGEGKLETGEFRILDHAIKDMAIVRVEKKSAIQYRLPKHFSYTQLKAFETCPLQYKFAHILYIPVKGKGVFSFGKTIHSTLQEFYALAKARSEKKQESLFSKKSGSQTGGKQHVKELVSEKELLEIYEKKWIEDWYESKQQLEEYRKKGQEAMKEYYQLTPETEEPPKYLEKDFHLKIGEYMVKGRIDRIDEIEPGKIEIIDYKTGSPKQDGKLSEGDKEQLYIYQLAVERLFGEKVARLSYYYIGENKKISFLGSSEKLKELEEKLTTQIHEIEKSDFIATPSYRNCEHCDFKNICEFRWKG